jgi:hypothetical protein
MLARQPVGWRGGNAPVSRLRKRPRRMSACTSASEQFLVRPRTSTRSTIDAMNGANATTSTHRSWDLGRWPASFSVRGGAALLVWFVGWSLRSPPHATPGASSCRELLRERPGVPHRRRVSAERVQRRPRLRALLERTDAGCTRARRTPTDGATGRSAGSIERPSCGRAGRTTTGMTWSASASMSDPRRMSSCTGT